MSYACALYAGFRSSGRLSAEDEPGLEGVLYPSPPNTPMIGTPNPGETLDHYRIEKLISRGGMATLFRGIDTRTGQPVAIKIPHPELECDPLFFDRFHREADLGRKFDHPGVVKVLPRYRSLPRLHGHGVG